jgi:MFS family permease
MLSHQIRTGVTGSGSLLDSIDAVRNVHAVALLLATFVAAALIAALASSVAQESAVLALLFVLIAAAMVFYGLNAVGVMMMDEANGHPSRPIAAAIISSLATSHRLVLVLLIVAALYLLGAVALALLLFICKVPGLGPFAYTFLFPTGVVVSGIAIFAVPTVIVPLSAPAIWNGASIMGGVSQVIAVARKRLLLVVLLMFGVGLMAGLVGGLVAVILASGTAFTTLVATAVVLSGSGGLAGVTPSLLGSFPSGGLSGGLGAYTIPTMVGGGIVYAAALTLPGLVYLRGASGVYLRAIEGLDLVAAQEALREKVTAAQARAKEFQVQAQATAQQYAQRAHAPAPAVVGAAVGAGPIADVIPALSSACPACATTVVPGDVFCGSCGHRLV